MKNDWNDDEEFGRRLRDAVPEPGPGYWEGIDHSLGDSREDTDRSLVRLTGMTNQSKSSAKNRYMPVLVAAAAVVVLGAIALIARDADDGSTDLASETTDATRPSAADTADPADGPSVETGISCYLGDETPAGLVVRLEEADDGLVSATTYFAPGGADGEVFITVAEGEVLGAGGTLQMLEVTLGEGAVSTKLWERNEFGLSLAEDVAVSPVDCDRVSAELEAIDAAVAAQPDDPLRESRRWGELAVADLAISPGTYCFANDDEEFPSERYIRMTVNGDATVTAMTSGGSSSEVTGNVVGTFSTPTDMVVTVERSFESQPAVTSREVWRFVPLTGELLQGPMMFTLGPVDCAEIAPMFTE